MQAVLQREKARDVIVRGPHLHDVTGCKQWTMEEWWEQAHARARAIHRATASFNMR